MYLRSSVCDAQQADVVANSEEVQQLLLPVDSLSGTNTQAQQFADLNLKSQGHHTSKELETLIILTERPSDV